MPKVIPNDVHVLTNWETAWDFVFVGYVLRLCNVFPTLRQHIGFFSVS